MQRITKMSPRCTFICYPKIEYLYYHTCTPVRLQKDLVSVSCIRIYLHYRIYWFNTFFKRYVTY